MDKIKAKVHKFIQKKLPDMKTKQVNRRVTVDLVLNMVIFARKKEDSFIKILFRVFETISPTSKFKIWRTSRLVCLLNSETYFLIMHSLLALANIRLFFWHGRTPFVVKMEKY